jgi:molybdate transport system substrate-binding protein
MTLPIRRGAKRALFAIGLGIACASLTMRVRAAETTPIEITVSAAASLTDAFKDMAQAFETQRPDIKVTLNFAASGVLLGQLKQGAPVDVLATADERTMDRAASDNLVDGKSRVDFAANSLVVVTPKGSPAPATLQSLADPRWKRIAMGTAESVPAGEYAREALNAAGLAVALEPQMIYGGNVRQVLAYVARGEVDAGFVYRTDAMTQASKVTVAFNVPLPTPVLYPIALVSGSKHAAAARSFVDFVRTGIAQKILARFGFSKP